MLGLQIMPVAPIGVLSCALAWGVHAGKADDAKRAQGSPRIKLLARTMHLLNKRGFLKVKCLCQPCAFALEVPLQHTECWKVDRPLTMPRIAQQPVVANSADLLSEVLPAASCRSAHR